MPDSPPPETLSWLRHAASCGQRDAQLTLHILERLEALEQRPIPGTVELAAPYSPEGELVEPAAQPAPPAAPAGGLVERVTAAIGQELSQAAEARAAIREVATWLRENEFGYHAALSLEQEAGR